MTIIKKHMGAVLLTATLMAGGLLVGGCANSDYDLNQIDATMGFGGNELLIPTSSTMEIPLKDILELEENGCVVIDQADSSYVFRRNGETIDPVHPNIEKILITKQHASTSDIVLNLSTAYAKGRGMGTSAILHGDADIYTFSYTGERPASVVELTHADVSSSMQLEVDLATLSAIVGKLDKLVLTFPKYMEIACDKGELDGNALILMNVATDSKLTLNIQVKGLDFETGESGLDVGEQIRMNGKVHMYVEASDVTTGIIQSVTVKNRLTMSDVTVESATGRFDPSIDLSELGKVSISGIPDFLSGSNVTVDLYNPVIKLNVLNDMPIGGKLRGTLKGYKGGSLSSVVDVSDIAIGAEQSTQAYICRRGDEMATGDGIVVKEVENLSKIVEPIPDEIAFEATAQADKETAGTFVLGHTYTVAPSYSIEAPIAFDEDAVIEYSKTWDGWNDDIKDVELSDGAYVVMTATALNKIPATLSLEATPIDKEGSNIGNLLEVDIRQGVVLASPDGRTATSSALEIVVREKVKGALQKLDGLEYKVLGEATHEGTSVTGIVLNARDHTLKLDDIKIKIVGRVIGDFN